MKGRMLFGLVIFLAAISICGCGFGGFSGSDGGAGGATTGQPNPPNADTIIQGVVSKGIFRAGTVKIYAVNPDGSVPATPLRENTIGAFGNYSANIGPSRGVVQIEATGTYTDEATGNSTSTEKPLRAFIANPNGTVKVAVTPMTELAARNALRDLNKRKMTDPGATLTAVDVEVANALLTGIFKVLMNDNSLDIIVSQPLSALTQESSTPAQKNYFYALGAISHMAYRKNITGDQSNAAGNLSALLDVLAVDLDNGSLSDENIMAFKDAYTAFLRQLLP